MTEDINDDADLRSRNSVVRQVERFLDANYDADHDKEACGPGCPGNFFEADALVRMVEEAVGVELLDVPEVGPDE